MARRKLPLLTERSLDQIKAERIELSTEFKATLTSRTSCSKGCSACCSYPVYISILEGMLLFRHLTDRGYWTPSFRKKLEIHADKTWDLAAEIWLLLDMPCPLLDKGKCLAYEARPFTCRTTYSFGDPYNCVPKRLTSGRFADKSDITARFRKVETEIFAKHKLSLLGMPISKAILLGEKVLTGDADLEHFLSIALESLPS
jgi:Fe-S-cluster containining protein